MKLVQDAHDWLHWHSIRASGIGAILSAAATGLSLASSAGTLAGVVPMWAVCALFFLIFSAAVVGRLLDQPSLSSPEPDKSA